MINVLLLALCQGLLLVNAVTLVAVGALAGYALADNKALATLPATLYVIGAALSTFPASLYMKRVGRRAGFLTGATFGLAGSVLATAAIAIGSLATLCAGTFLFGIYNAFGQYYRFAAADAAAPALRAKAISYVMAGGLIGGIVGPEVSKFTRDLAQPTYMASYASLFLVCLAAMATIAFLRIPLPKEERLGGEARPFAAIARQPAFVVAVSVAALGYGTMNLLMTATPLAMGFCGHPYSASATVITGHVVAMFAPSFFTGALIQRFGVLNVILAGVAAMLACVATALTGQQVANFWWALVLLGLGWNFMYIGGTTLLTETYRPAEKAKAQGFNELVVFGIQGLSALASGVLVNTRGWDVLNYTALPLIVAAGAASLWLAARRRTRSSPSVP